MAGNIRTHNPEQIAGPFATYAHGVSIDGPVRWLFGAGQTGVAGDGSTPADIEGQAKLVWANMRAVLADAGMGIDDIVQLNMLLIDRNDAPGAMAVRNEELEDHRPASTLMYVSGLARPEWLIEIDYIAARPVG